MDKNLLDLEHELNYYFNDRNLLKNALIHKSFANETKKYQRLNNERLELLGDSVLGLVVVEYLYKKLKKYNEGELAKLKAMCVSEPILARVSRKMKVGQHLFMSKGEQVSGGRDRESILADTFEAILGAIYLDSGFYEAKNFVLYHLKEYIDNIEHDEDIIDYKTMVQEYSQKKYKVVPTYKVISESGPDHMKEFEVEVIIGGMRAIAIARNKKNAEQLAAKKIFKQLGDKINETL